MSCDIVMGNVAPLRKRITELEERVHYLEMKLYPLDKSEKERTYIHVEGDLTSLQWSGGDI